MSAENLIPIAWSARDQKIVHAHEHAGVGGAVGCLLCEGSLAWIQRSVESNRSMFAHGPHSKCRRDSAVEWSARRKIEEDARLSIEGKRVCPLLYPVCACGEDCPPIAVRPRQASLKDGYVQLDQLAIVPIVEGSRLLPEDAEKIIASGLQWIEADAWPVIGNPSRWRVVRSSFPFATLCQACAKAHLSKCAEYRNQVLVARAAEERARIATEYVERARKELEEIKAKSDEIKTYLESEEARALELQRLKLIDLKQAWQIYTDGTQRTLEVKKQLQVKVDSLKMQLAIYDDVHAIREGRSNDVASAT